MGQPAVELDLPPITTTKNNTKERRGDQRIGGHSVCEATTSPKQSGVDVCMIHGMVWTMAARVAIHSLRNRSKSQTFPKKTQKKPQKALVVRG